VASLKDIAVVLATADPKLKAEIYEELGITVKYDPTRRLVSVESRPPSACTTVSVGGGDLNTDGSRVECPGRA
jgi:hypothetical protein